MSILWGEKNALGINREFKSSFCPLDFRMIRQLNWTKANPDLAHSEIRDQGELSSQEDAA